MITIILGFLALGALTMALCLSVYARNRVHQLSANQKRHLGFAVFSAFMGIVIPCGVLVQAISSGDSSMSAPESVYEYARISGGFTNEQLKTISAGVRYAHKNYWGSSGREFIYLVYPLCFVLLAGLHWQFAFEDTNTAKTASE